MAFQSLHFYCKKNGFTDVASRLNRPHANPDEYFSLGYWQCTQNPPQVCINEDGLAEVGRWLYGKWVVQKRATIALREWLGDGKLKCDTVPNTLQGRLYSATHNRC